MKFRQHMPNFCDFDIPADIIVETESELLEKEWIKDWSKHWGFKQYFINKENSDPRYYLLALFEKENKELEWWVLGFLTDYTPKDLEILKPWRKE